MRVQLSTNSAANPLTLNPIPENAEHKTQHSNSPINQHQDHPSPC